MYSNSVLYAVLLFGCYIVLLYLFTILLVYIVLILDCVGYFHRPKKPLIQSRYTHISECFLLARLRRRINYIACASLYYTANATLRLYRYLTMQPKIYQHFHQ